MKPRIISAAVLLALSTTSAFAISDGIRRDKDNECALYLCVPGGFISDSCRVPHKRFI